MAHKLIYSVGEKVVITTFSSFEGKVGIIRRAEPHHEDYPYRVEMLDSDSTMLWLREEEIRGKKPRPTRKNALIKWLSK